MAPGHFLWVQTLLIHLLCMFLNLYATGQTHLRMPVYSNKLLKILAWCLCYYKLFKPLTSCYISFISDFLLPVIYLTQGKVLFVHKRSFPNMMTTNVLTWHILDQLWNIYQANTRCSANFSYPCTAGWLFAVSKFFAIIFLSRFGKKTYLWRLQCAHYEWLEFNDAPKAMLPWGMNLMMFLRHCCLGKWI